MTTEEIQTIYTEYSKLVNMGPYDYRHINLQSDGVFYLNIHFLHNIFPNAIFYGVLFFNEDIYTYTRPYYMCDTPDFVL